MNTTLEMEEQSLYRHGITDPAHKELFEAESMLLGAIFLEPERIHEITLEPQHFSARKEQYIFRVMRELQDEGKVIDIVTMANHMGDGIGNIGGISYLTALAVACPSVYHLQSYEQIILQHYKLRTLRQSAADFLHNNTYDKAEDFYQTFIDLQEIGKETGPSRRDILTDLFEEMYEDRGALSGIDTGFAKLNDMTGGLNGGDLMIIAGRPSMGKSAFALNLAMNACKNGGVTDVFSLEMPQKQMVKRILSALTNIDGAKWRNPYRYFTKEDQKRADASLNLYDQWHLFIHDRPSQTIADIRAQILKTKREYPGIPYLVIIDYLQLISHSGKFERHDLAIGKITKELKQIARGQNVPILLLSQLSRGVEQRQDKRPVMSDLRDSGSIEQDADLIMLLYRDEYYDRKSKDKNTIEINLAKHRNGPTGTIKFGFQKEFSRFIER